MIVLHASGTQSATVTTEHSLATAVVYGKFRLEVDLNAMVSGDITEIRVYKIILTSGTKRLMFYRMFCGAQPSHALIFSSDEFYNDLTDANSLEFSLKQTFGTSRSYPWKVVRESSPVTLHSSGTQVATITTEHSLATAIVQGVFKFEIDLNAMASGDILEVRSYKIILTSGTKRLMYYNSFCGAQPSVSLIFSEEELVNDLADASSLEWSIKQTFGTGRSYPWKVLRAEASTTPVGQSRIVQGIGTH